MVSLNSGRNPNKDSSWYQGLVYYCDRPDHSLIWDKVDFGSLD